MLFAVLNGRGSETLSILFILDLCFPFIPIVCGIFNLLWFLAGLAITDVVTDVFSPYEGYTQTGANFGNLCVWFSFWRPNSSLDAE